MTMPTKPPPAALTAVLAASVLTALAACDQPSTSTRSLAGQEVSLSSAKKLDVSRCATTNTGFTTNFSHPYFGSTPVGNQLVLEADEGGEHTRNEVTVLALTRNIGGVTTRVIEEREFTDGTLAEVTYNYFVQASDGSICYYGEDVDVYENGTITHEGAWCGVGPNQPGIFLPADPQVGMEFQNEVAPGIAEDEARIVGKGPVTVPAGTFHNTIRIRESNPLDGGKDFKVFAAGVGIVVDGVQKLTRINQTAGTPPLPAITLFACGS
jgi:hypothetical protein